MSPSFFSTPQRWTGMSSWAHEPPKMSMKMMGKMMFRNIRNNNYYKMGGYFNKKGMKQKRMIMKIRNKKRMRLSWSELRQRKKNMAMRARRKFNRRQQRMEQRRQWREWQSQQQPVDPQIHVYHLYYDKEDGGFEYGVHGDSVDTYDEAFRRRGDGDEDSFDESFRPPPEDSKDDRPIRRRREDGSDDTEKTEWLTEASVEDDWYDDDGQEYYDDDGSFEDDGIFYDDEP